MNKICFICVCCVFFVEFVVFVSVSEVVIESGFSMADYNKVSGRFLFFR